VALTPDRHLPGRLDRSFAQVRPSCTMGEVSCGVESGRGSELVEKPKIRCQPDALRVNVGLAGQRDEDTVLFQRGCGRIARGRPWCRRCLWRGALCRLRVCRPRISGPGFRAPGFRPRRSNALL